MAKLLDKHYRMLELAQSYGDVGLNLNDPHIPRGGHRLLVTLDRLGLASMEPMSGGQVEWESLPGDKTRYKYKTWQLTRAGRKALRHWYNQIPF